MAINTYAALQSDILDTLNRTDLVADVTAYSPGSIEGAVKRAIRRGELRMQRELMVRELQESSTVSYVASSAIYSLPNDFAAFNYVFLSTDPISPLAIKSLAQLYDDEPSQTVGEPNALAVYGTTYRLRPTPDGSYTGNLFYNRKIDALSDSNTGNDILDNYYDVYLYASLLECAPHLKEDERIQVWKGFYDEARRTINQDSTLIWTGTLQSNVNRVTIV